MDFVDASGTRYQLVESTETPVPAKKPVMWPWVVGGLAVVGGLVWMASSTSRSPNPVTPEMEALIAEAHNPGTSLDRLLNLVSHPDGEVRRALLDNPNVCPTKADGKLYTRLLESLARQFPKEIVAHPLFVLHALIEPTHEFEGVVRAVVERTEDVGLIERILSTWGSWNSDVRLLVASNPTTPVDILRLLGNEMTEKEWWVRQAVAKNPNPPVDLLRSLGNKKTESNADVRWAVASNPNTPVDVLRLLANKKTESDKWVRQAAQKALADRGLA